MGALSSTSPVQNSASSPTSPSDLNDMKISTETTPKPRKFFKSRNAAPPAEIQQQIALQQQMAMQMHHQPHQTVTSNHHNFQQSSADESVHQKTPSPQKQQARKKQTPKKEKIEKPKIEKPQKVKKEKPPKEPKIKEVVRQPSPDSDEEVVSPRRGRAQAEGTRSSGRARGKLVNYNEDKDEEEFFSRTEKRIVPKQLKALQQDTPSHTITTSSIESQNLHSQNSMESSNSSNPAINHPPIVLRISKVRNLKISLKSSLIHA